jgi:hypothetical protein
LQKWNETNKGTRLVLNAREGLLFLCGLAIADGCLHPDEIEVMISYACREAEESGLPYDDDDVNYTLRYVESQRPSAEDIEDVFTRLRRWGRTRTDRLLKAAQRLSAADGVEMTEEFELLTRARDEIGSGIDSRYFETTENDFYLLNENINNTKDMANIATLLRIAKAHSFARKGQYV